MHSSPFIIFFISEYLLWCSEEFYLLIYSMFLAQGTLHVKWAMEKSSLESAKLEADKKIKELDEQASELLHSQTVLRTHELLMYVP